MTAHTYITTDKPRGVLYTGVTSHLQERMRRHREKVHGGFTAKYRCTTLVRYERHESIVRAIRREKAIKRWPRDWKIDLIEGFNPAWDDLFDTCYEVDNPYRSNPRRSAADPRIKSEDDGVRGL